MAYRKEFSQELSDEFDPIGRELATRVINKVNPKLVVKENKKFAHLDLSLYNENKLVGYCEVAVRLIDFDRYPTLHVEEQKGVYFLEAKESGMPVVYIAINKTRTKAAYMNGLKALKYKLFNLSNKGDRSGRERFFDVPKHEFTFVDIPDE